MIIIARMGGVELVCDDEINETRPTPECIADTAKRIAAITLETYLSLPDGLKVATDGDDD